MTTAEAAAQPYAELGLKDDEYARIIDILGRRPSDEELAMYSIMWSEHCSYKSSKVHLRRFGDAAATNEHVLAGIGENAGVIGVGGDLAVTFKVESHNHPSFVEPYQGAATGVGGIVRDILAMGARPVAVMDSLRFGDADAPDTRRLVDGVVAGVGGYGNCLGLPNIGGEITFDPSYAGNPLVNALCLGVLPVDRLHLAAAKGVGNVVVLIGAKTGRDGIGGVSVLASATFEEGSSAKRPAVQVGDPFTEKVLIECCLELFDRGLVVAIQDLGGAGLTCALSETAAKAGLGMAARLEAVPLREPSMTATEVLASESQERMLAIVSPDRLDEVLATCRRWGALATPIAEVTDTGRLVITWHGDVVVDVPPASLADEGPVYDRPMTRSADLDALQADEPTAERLPRPSSGDELRSTLLALAGSANLSSRRWVTDQYDRYVRGNTVLSAPEDAGVLRLADDAPAGVALALDGNGRFARLDPFAGAQLALAEACRNVAAVGARPIAATDCLNFGSPENPEVMWQFAEAVRGLAEACAAMSTPVIGGNVSFYNQTGDAPINPTPVVGVLGLIDDVARRTPMAFSTDGDAIVLLGETRDELGGSEWAWVAHRHLGGRPPQLDLAAERALVDLLVALSESAAVSAAHDLSEGGLAQAVVESCLRGGRGAALELPDDAEPFVALFSESASRAVVATADPDAVLALAARHGVPASVVGRVGGAAVVVPGLFEVAIEDLREAWESTLPRLFG